MLKYFITFLIFSWILSTQLQLNAQTVISPEKWDTLFIGDTAKIKWENSRKLFKKINIKLYQGDNLLTNIANSKRNREKYNWVIPYSIAPDLLYTFKFSGIPNQVQNWVSDGFYICKPSIKIIKPNSKSEWNVNNFYNIMWINKGGEGQNNLSIQLLQNGLLIKTLGSRVENDGSSGCSFPDTLRIKTGNNYKIKIINMLDTTIYACSQDFTINVSSYNFKSLNNIPLVWKPRKYFANMQTLAHAKEIHKAKFHLMDFEDERKEPQYIGVNTERKPERKVTVSEPVSMWCKESMRWAFERCQLNVDSTDYTHVLKGKIKMFFVAESTEYHALIDIHFQAVSKEGEIVWEKSITGEADNWGTSYRAINYYECLSDAFLNVIQALIEDNSFKKAVLNHL